MIYVYGVVVLLGWVVVFIMFMILCVMCGLIIVVVLVWLFLMKVGLCSMLLLLSVV